MSYIHSILLFLFPQVFLEKQYNLIHAISLLVAMSSSVLNPLMYGWFNSNFRKAFSELLGRDLNSFNSQRMKAEDENASPSEKKGPSKSDKPVGNLQSNQSVRFAENGSPNNGEIKSLDSNSDLRRKESSDQSAPVRKHMWKFDHWKSLDSDSHKSVRSRKDSVLSFDSRKSRMERSSRSSDSGRSIRERLDSLKSSCSIKGYRRMEETIEPILSPDLPPVESELSPLYQNNHQEKTQTVRGQVQGSPVSYHSMSTRWGTQTGHPVLLINPLASRTDTHWAQTILFLCQYLVVTWKESLRISTLDLQMSPERLLKINGAGILAQPGRDCTSRLVLFPVSRKEESTHPMYQNGQSWTTPAVRVVRAVRMLDNDSSWQSMYAYGCSV